MFRLENNSDARYKVRLAAKGSYQHPDLDYKETFSPIIKPTTIRHVLSIAVACHWPIRQLHFNRSFLNDFLTKTVYMKQGLHD